MKNVNENMLTQNNIFFTIFKFMLNNVKNKHIFYNSKCLFCVNLFLCYVFETLEDVQETEIRGATEISFRHKKCFFEKPK